VEEEEGAGVTDEPGVQGECAVVELKMGQAHDPMSWMDFVASLVGSLAWPLAAIIIALLFRMQIAGLLNKIRRLTWGDKALDFAGTLDKLETASRDVGPAEADATKPSHLPDERFQNLLRISPSAAILDAWRPVEQTLRQVGARKDYDPRILQSPTQIMKKLTEEGAITTPVYEMLRDLQRLRNVAAHQREVHPTDALRFTMSRKRPRRR
jgi:hypothetical protein